ncbi:MAG TPA: acyl-ACP--UDP-N-acetylglucosamine O-acyltransferase [Thermoanaerobaculia bacterium]|jgi:UDP-N-acetylglucosamine acyltransferase|nr:acyl-ACP--UDP-N-acetylglucosamine O-acyltransferase [Thermoanaerobaculia bacterium]
MTSHVHALAHVDPAAILGDDVRVGPFAVIGAGVEIGDGTEIGAGAQVQGPTRIGRGNRIFPQTAIGFDPQDLKYQGEPVRLEIGDDNTIREFCTVSRGTAAGGAVTRIGSQNLLMAYVHIAHDCQLGDRTVFANLATLAGHVEVHDDAIVGAFCTVHQFARIGRHAYLGAYTVMSKDALPFVKTVGVKPACYGINTIGLKRKGFSSAQVARLGRAFRLLARSGLNTRQALARMREELGGDPEVDHFIAFIESSRRGVTKTVPRGMGRGAGDEEGGEAEGPGAGEAAGAGSARDAGNAGEVAVVEAGKSR